MKDNRVTKKRKLQFFVYDIANLASSHSISPKGREEAEIL